MGETFPKTDEELNSGLLENLHTGRKGVPASRTVLVLGGVFFIPADLEAPVAHVACRAEAWEHRGPTEGWTDEWLMFTRCLPCAALYLSQPAHQCLWDSVGWGPGARCA
jgi:hypothetical protein